MLKKCSGLNSCELEKELSEFNTRIRSKKLGRITYRNLCKKCSINNLLLRNINIGWDASLKLNRTKNRIENLEKFMIQSVKASAKSRNIEFNLNISDIIVPKFCPILGIEFMIQKGGATDNSPSIDRIFNNKGYIPSNIIIISLRANKIKKNATIEELELIYNNYYNINVENNDDLNYNKWKMLDSAKQRAKKNNIELNITKNDIIIPFNCPIFGIELKKGKDKPISNSPSLDRIDNTKGYVKGNIRVISYRANILKSYSSYEEYKSIYLYIKNVIASRGI